MNIMYKPWPEGPGKSTFALRGWMQFTTAKNAKEFIKHWSRIIQARLESGGTPFLVAVEHSMTSLNSGHSVQVGLAALLAQSTIVAMAVATSGLKNMSFCRD